MSKCPNCGHELQGGMKFCPECGQDLAVAVPKNQRIPTEEVPLPPLPDSGVQGRSESTSAPLSTLNEQNNEQDASPATNGEKKSHSWKIVLGACVGILILGVLLSVSAVGGNSTAHSDETFTKENYAQLDSEPAKHKGANVDITGRLLKNPEVDDNATYLQVFADPEHSEWNTLVVAKKLPDMDLHQGDYVRVEGTVLGEMSGTNAFGATVKGPKVQAKKVTKTSKPT
jgi:hypothetical protein